MWFFPVSHTLPISKYLQYDSPPPEWVGGVIARLMSRFGGATLNIVNRPEDVLFRKYTYIEFR